MKNEYIIINRTALEKRIENLEKQRDEYSFNPNRTDDYYRYNSIIKVIKEVLSQSTPLIPEIEKAFDKGVCSIQENSSKLKVKMPKAKQDYISNLKLDI